MKDRLIELLKQRSCVYYPCDRECGECHNVEMYEDAIESIADHLLANGVVVPPCKVGDTVYCIWQYSDFAKEDTPFIQETRVISFVIDEGVPKIIPANYGEMTDSWHRLLEVAFTKAEAEKALAERRENNG